MFTRRQFRIIQRTPSAESPPEDIHAAFEMQKQRIEELEDTVFQLQERVRDFIDFLSKPGSLYITRANISTCNIDASPIGATTASTGKFTSVDNSGTYKYAGTAVLGGRQTGYTDMTGTLNRGTEYATGTITLIQLAERVGAIQRDLTVHGIIGA